MPEAATGVYARWTTSIDCALAMIALVGPATGGGEEKEADPGQEEHRLVHMAKTRRSLFVLLCARTRDVTSRRWRRRARSLPRYAGCPRRDGVEALVRPPCEAGDFRSGRLHSVDHSVAGRG